jgi:hypothetical protein
MAPRRISTQPDTAPIGHRLRAYASSHDHLSPGSRGSDERLRNQKQLALNNYGRADGVKSGRGGKALLSGIMTSGAAGGA